MTRKRIYLAGPISKGDLLHNVRQADAAFLALAQAGLAPWNPVLSVYAGASDRPDQWPTRGVRPVWAVAERNSSLPLAHADWLDIDLAWVAVADAVLRLPGESAGAVRECFHAAMSGVPVFHSVAEVVAYFASPLT